MRLYSRIHLLVSGIPILLFGVLIYVFFYPTKITIIPFFGIDISEYKVSLQSPFLNSIIYSITSFIHVIVMTLFASSASINISHKIIVKWGLFWGIVNTIFEIMQSEYILSKSNLSLNWIAEYSSNNTYSHLDLLFIWCAFFLIFILFGIRKDVS
ncbi:MAG: hypothetical protein AB2708_20070 [Candidatus Thiodiazotropha taylori]